MKAPFLAAGLLAAGAGALAIGRAAQCKCFSGDACWPPASAWNSLNETVGGRLIATVPLAEACHDHNYDPARCQALREGWQNSATQATAGALSAWTHKLNSIEFKEWKGGDYTGSAVKLGGGVQAFQVLSAVLEKKQAVVGGECPTVGLAGGYNQGGGHSALSTSFGLSADNTLEFEVVTAASELVTASRTQNAETFKTFPDAVVCGATLAFYADDNPAAIFYGAIDAFHAALPDMVSAGAMVVYYFTSSFFQRAPLTAYNKTAAEVEAMLSPFAAKLTAMGVKYTLEYSQSATYYDHYDKYFGPLSVGNIEVGIVQYGGRLVPLSAFANCPTAMSAVTRYIADKGVTWICVGTDVSRFGKNGSNAVLPASRTPLVHATLTTPWSFDPAEWDQILANQRLTTDDIIPRIKAVTPGSGAYMDEADFQQPNFQQAFFGSNYQSLLCVKQKYDPEGFFWATKAVGSEKWTVANDGRICQAS
ncbi:uncharacterized protein P884DRAFT_279522 [Thermothelomyces heterothallicus CBS 202.75]|uniref:uncharacterized protein n=1 Tax=Thermothelomyces heterothallicus CBS 202.75 TaxID=1149848 RepID=UPI0037424FB0